MCVWRIGGTITVQSRKNRCGDVVGVEGEAKEEAKENLLESGEPSMEKSRWFLN